MFGIADLLRDICKEETGTEEVIQKVFDRYGMVMDANQYVLTVNQTPSSVPKAVMEKECPSMRAMRIPSGKTSSVNSSALLSCASRNLFLNSL